MTAGLPNLWPRAESLVFSWLRESLPDVNVAYETDATFGTDKPAALMRLPLVLIEVIGGRSDLNHITETSVLDLSCFADSRDKAWDLFEQVNACMLRAIGQPTPKGTLDDVHKENGPMAVSYNNPNLRRVIATYGVSTRAEATA